MSAHDLVKITLEIERIEEALKEAKKRKTALENLVSDQYQADEIRSQKVTVDGKDYTVFRRREFYCNVPAGNREHLVLVCQQLGMDDMVETTVQTSKLKAWMKEQVSGDDPVDGYDWDRVPEEVRDLVSVGESVKAVVRKG